MNRLVFPSAVMGTDPDPLRQVEEVVELMHEELVKHGLGIGAMLQHTLFVKADAVDPLAILGRFHPATYALAPQLKTAKSVGTIIQVPEFPDPRTFVMLDVIAGRPLVDEPGGPGRGEDGYVRLPFEYGPAELSETVGDDLRCFTAGLEGLDFKYNRLAPDLEGQIATVVDKLVHAASAAGLTLAHMIYHNLYVRADNDPLEVIDKLHAEMARHEPSVKDHISAGALMLVDGMATKAFRLEMDAVFTKEPAHAPKRIPWGSLNVAESVADGDLVFVSAMPGVDRERGMCLAEGLDAQLEMAVRNVATALARQGSTVDRLLKYRVALKRGAGDANEIRAKVRELFVALASTPGAFGAGELVLVTEGLLGERLVEVTAVAAR